MSEGNFGGNVYKNGLGKCSWRLAGEDVQGQMSRGSVGHWGDVLTTMQNYKSPHAMVMLRLTQTHVQIAF